MNKSPLIAIVGVTCSGKSGLAMKIAEELSGEIIAADSRTLYKGMDIGTAKPNAEDQKKVDHHGLDLKKPAESFSAAEFKKYAVSAIEDISNRGKVPILVGGTGLYIDAVLFDFDFGNKKNDALRTKLSQQTIKELEEIAKENDIFYDNEMLKNKRRLIRAIENGGVVKAPKPMRENTLVLGVEITKNELRQRIKQRVELMFKQGLRKEVQRLIDEYGWESEALTGIGYREFKKYYDKEISMSQVKQNIVKNTMQYAKRQKTWFKRNTKTEWFDSQQDAFNRCKAFLKTKTT